MDGTTLFYLIQAIAVSIYLTLAVYVALCRSSRYYHFPFIAFALIEAFDAYALFVLRSPGGAPSQIPIILRLRWSLLAFLPGVFLHMFVPLVRGKLRQRARMLAFTAYALAILTSIAAFSGNLLIEGTIHRGATGADLIDPVFNLNATFFMSLWILPALAIVTLLLIRATRDTDQLRLQADAERLIRPWITLMLAALLGGIAVFLPADSTPGLNLILALSERLLSILAGLMLARGILRFGSPVGQPIDPRLAPLLLPLAAVVIVDFLLIYNTQMEPSPLHLMRLLLIGLISGSVLARPELPARVARWLGPTPPDDTFFAVRLSRAWESLAEGSFNVTQVSESLLALQEEIGAEYVGVLELVDVDDHRVITYGKWEDGPRVTMKSEHIDWPLTETTLQQTEYQTSGLSSAPCLMLPIHDEQIFAGILIIGQPIRGGIYSSGDLRLAELLTSLLSFALAHGLNLEETPSIPRKVELDSVMLPSVAVAIRTFGRLEIYVQNGGARGPRPSLRARQILAILLSAYPDPVPADVLMEQLWPEQPPDAAANSLSAAYSLLVTLQLKHWVNNHRLY